MKKLFILITIIPMFLILSGRVLSTEIGYGKIERGIYTNNYFNMSILVPDGWSVQSKAAIKEISDLGGNLVAGDDKNLQAIMKESEKQTVNMFAFFKYEQGSPVDFNPSILAMAERVTHMPGIKRGSDYLFHVKKLFQAGQVEYTFPKEIYTKEISGVSFDVMPAEINIGGTTVHQEYYATRIKDYVLGVVLTYATKPENNELNKIFNKLNFSK
jgi:hypothetical protein